MDAWDYAGLAACVDRIYRTADCKEGLLAADITGGTKMMSVAVALACLSPGRRMECVDADCDWQGQPLPQGTLRPVHLDASFLAEGEG